MSWFSKLFEKDDWRLCGTVDLPVVETNALLDSKKGKLYYYLYENQHGDRKFDVADTFRGDYDLDRMPKDDFIFRNEDYLTKVKPWMDGRKITGVTSYAKVPIHDFKNRLDNGE